jgi:antitoxin component YwqK of YwqJK toxin-antitoxin module
MYFRNDLPSLIRWYENGNKQEEIYLDQNNSICKIKNWNEDGLLIIKE